MFFKTLFVTKTMSNNLNNQSNSNKKNSNSNVINNQVSNPDETKVSDSFVKLAMRNMVKKGSTSLFHFALTIFGVIATLLGLAIAFH